MVESEGSAPSLTCLQDRCITCLPRPHENGRPPRCCPERTEFWRLGRASWRAACEKLVRLPGIAPGRAPWRGAILAVKSQPRKLKGPGEIALPARAISIKNKHLLVIYSIPARGFTAAVSVFGGTPPTKPLKCKSVSNHLGARLRSRWVDPSGGKPRLSRA